MIGIVVFVSSLSVSIWAGQSSSTAIRDVEQLLNETHDVAARLKSVDFVHSYEEPGHGERALRLREREGKLRGDHFFGPYVPDRDGDRVKTYDGTTYRCFDSKERRLSKTRQITDARVLDFGDPLSEPYMWMIAVPWSWSGTKSKASWLEYAAHAELLAPGSVGSIPCQRIRRNFENGHHQIIEIADGLRIPIRWAQYDESGVAVTECVVHEWKEYPTPDGPVALPTVVDSISRYVDGKTITERKVTFKVDLASVKINPELGEDVFIIPDSKAREIADADALEIVFPETGVVYKTNPDGSITGDMRRVPARTSWGTVTVFSALAAGVVAVLGILYVRRRAG